MWVWVILLAITLGIAYLSVRPGDCVIKCHAGVVTVRGRITRSQQTAVKEYLQRHFADSGRLRISLHYPRPGRRMRIRIRGAQTPGEEQMIRNFILSEF